MRWCNGRRDANYPSHHQAFGSLMPPVVCQQDVKMEKEMLAQDRNKITLFFRWNEVNEHFRCKEQVRFQGLMCLILWKSHLKIRQYCPCL